MAAMLSEVCCRQFFSRGIPPGLGAASAHLVIGTTLTMAMGTHWEFMSAYVSANPPG